jgi:hypothetical protein
MDSPKSSELSGSNLDGVRRVLNSLTEEVRVALSERRVQPHQLSKTMLKVPDRKTKALLDLADFFETLDPALYDQSTYHNPWTGARCICGWQNARTDHANDDHDKACATLGLSPATAQALFSAKAGQKTVRRSWLFGNVTEKPTPKEAAACLRHLAVTGELPIGW